MKHKRSRDIVIELTSLLDVVMILIFALMINNAQLVEASKNELESVRNENIAQQKELEEYKGISDELALALEKLKEGEIEELMKQVQSSESRLESYKYMDDIVVVFNVGLENKFNNAEKYLTYGKATDDEINQFNVKRTDTIIWNSAVSKFKIDLDEFIKSELSLSGEEKYIYIVFTIDESKIYANDFEDIDDAINEEVDKAQTERVRYRLTKK